MARGGGDGQGDRVISQPQVAPLPSPSLHHVHVLFSLEHLLALEVTHFCLCPPPSTRAKAFVHCRALSA